MTHTPGPWKIGEENVGGGFNIYAGTLRIAHTAIQARVFTPEGRVIDDVEAKSNATFLVSAANSHEAMANALRAALIIAKSEWDFPGAHPHRAAVVRDMEAALALSHIHDVRGSDDR